MCHMRRIFILFTLLMLFPLIGSAAQQKEIRTVAILGDSYSTFDGYIPEGNACWYFTTPQGDNDVVSVEQTWWHMFCRDCGYDLVLNESYSGSTICNTGYDGADYSDRAFIKRMRNVIAGNPDLIIVFGGTNDSWADAPVGHLRLDGSWTQEELYSCLPACCYLLEHLSKEAAGAEILFVINSELKYEIVAGIMEACDHYGVRHLLLKDIEKKWGHPSVKGMAQINEQIKTYITENIL